MKNRMWSGLVIPAIALGVVIWAGGWAAGDQESPSQAGEKVGIEGTFVRVAENQEGWVVVGYGTANESVGKDWMLLDVGITLQHGVKSQKLTRDQVTLVTPDHTVIPLATQEEIMKARGDLEAMSRADAMMHDSINYFPADAPRECRIGFFTDPSQMQPGMAYDQVDLNNQAACVGRVYFHVPNGIQYGDYNLDVKFEDSVVRVPMNIMTKEQAEEFEKKWKEERKEAKHKGHEH